jgi:tRNA pseudouridine38-40 synthase
VAVHQPLDEAAMAEAASRLVGGTTSTFRSVHCQADSPVRTLDLLSVERGRCTPYAAAGRFLHHRCVRWSAVSRWSAWAAGRRTMSRRHWSPATARAGLGAPSDRLFFVAADYPSDG